MKKCPFASYDPEECGDWCELYKKQEKVCTLQSIDIKRLSKNSNFK
ncbi:hypothetical protein HKBW3C_02497, partial [Candidatus Hakubella thermalkaliphila]